MDCAEGNKGRKLPVVMPLIIWGSMVVAWKCGCRVGNVLEGGRENVNYGISDSENEYVDSCYRSLHPAGGMWWLWACSSPHWGQRSLGAFSVEVSLHVGRMDFV